MEILKNFVVFEGPDGSGTTTQLGMLADFLLRRKSPIIHTTFEPTEGIIGKIIRQGLRNEISLKPETIALLFAADRNEHLYGAGGVIEHCRQGQLVVSDRYVPSSLVYQGITCGKELPMTLNRDFPGPELLLFFDLDPECAQKRMAGRRHKEIYEYLDFQIQVRGLYKALLPYFEEQGVKVHVIDASRSPEEVAAEVWRTIEKLPIIRG